MAPPVSLRWLFGLPFAALRLRDVVEICAETFRRGGHLTVGVANAAKIVWMRSDLALRDATLASDLLLADGMSVVWASRILGRPLPERVAGIDLFLELLRQAESSRRPVYFLGAEENVLRAMLARISRDYPGLPVAGARHGYFSDSEEPAVAEAVRASGAAYLFLGISSPTKELFLSRWGRSLGVHVCHGVGGSFDVLAGKTRRAPRWLQRAGLEWLYRLLQEPRRLWKRYLYTNAVFLALVVKERFSPAPPLPRPVAASMPGSRD
jgi:N-acetylglucosaminyldiphosphoundecaprenol N-acetyl-beta-D-mannosaminyltransferase